MQKKAGRCQRLDLPRWQWVWKLQTTNFGVLNDEPFINEYVFQSRYLLHELVFACSDILPRPYVNFTMLNQSEWCALRTVARCELALLPVAGDIGEGALVFQVKRAHTLCEAASRALLLAPKQSCDLYPILASGRFVFFKSGSVRLKRCLLLFLRTRLS